MLSAVLIQALKALLSHCSLCVPSLFLIQCCLQSCQLDIMLSFPPLQPTAAQQANSAVMLDQLTGWCASPAGAAMQAARQNLPISAIHVALLAALRDSDVVVVSGDTGCGKTTQVRKVQLE